jgi:hypothetical protein
MARLCVAGQGTARHRQAGQGQAGKHRDFRGQRNNARMPGNARAGSTVTTLALPSFLKGTQ